MSLIAQQAQKRHRRRKLQQELLDGGEAGVAVMPHLLVVVNVSDDTEYEGKKIHINVGKVSVYHALPAQDHHGDADADDEHESAHGGGALLGHVPGGADLLDALSGLELDQLRDQQFTGNSRYDKTNNAGQNDWKDHTFLSSFRPVRGFFRCVITGGTARSPARPWESFYRRSPDKFRGLCRTGR